MPKPLDERELEATLSQIGGRLDYPDANLWPAVRERIARRRAAPWWSRFELRPATFAPVAATLAVILVAAFLLTPDLAARAAETLGLPGAQIFRVRATPPPAVRPQPVPTFAGQPVTTLAAASAVAGFQVRAPADLGDPDAIYVETAPVRVTLVYRQRSGIPVSPLAGVSAIIVEFRGRFDPAVLSKTAGPETRVETVPFAGSFGYWISGQPHQLFYYDASGNFQQETLRLAGNTLLWEQGGVTYRLEAEVTKEEAVRIASTNR
jgi:hypothetical protein